MQVNVEQINKLGIKSEFLNPINFVLIKYDINTPLRIQHFLAQVLHESGNLKVFSENLNYSENGLMTVFKKYFPTKESTIGYVRNPVKIANKVYSNRMGNGDELSGDGFKYKGRGAIQLTGKNNYSNISKDTGIDFVKRPELLETIEYALLSAGWYWNKAKLNQYADKDDIITITRKINGGLTNLEDRKLKLIKCKSVIH